MIDAQSDFEAALENGSPDSALQARHPASEKFSEIKKNTSQIPRDTAGAALGIKSLESRQSVAKPLFICELRDPQTDLPCGKAYVAQAGLLRHQRSALHRAEKGNFACTICSQKYVFPARLKKHMRDKHGHQSDSNKAEDAEEGNESPDKSSLTSHDHSPNDPYPENSTVAGSGRQETKAPNRPPRNPAKTAKCTLPILKTGQPCNRIFSLEKGTHNLKQHQNSAVHKLIPSRKFKCIECRSSFSSSSLLSTHMRDKHGIQAFRTAEFSDEESDSSDDELPASSTSVISQTEADNTSSDLNSLVSKDDD